ncbi:MAG: MaoC family dehydratase N-terminal domain-containing protein [Deltaproteobacteria bacterium]|nr:MaoC family dehydratase N-terminal domain-containing protein [Deltaproteobacteria bacterium]
MKKEFSYENLEVGEELGRKEVLITDEMIRACAQAIESQHPWYFEDSPFGGRIAPPTIFDNDTLRMLDEKYERFGSIHAKQSWEFKNPAKLGKKVTLTVRVVDKYIKRERAWIVMELVTVDEDGLEICRGRHTSLMSLKGGVANDQSP